VLFSLAIVPLFCSATGFDGGEISVGTGRKGRRLPKLWEIAGDALRPLRTQRPRIGCLRPLNTFAKVAG